MYRIYNMQALTHYGDFNSWEMVQQLKYNLPRSIYVASILLLSEQSALMIHTVAYLRNSNEKFLDIDMQFSFLKFHSQFHRGV